MCIPGEDMHSWCGTSPFPVKMNHNGMNIFTGNGDVSHREWGYASPRMGMCLAVNSYLHREWGCASPGMHTLTWNGNVPHRECISLPRTRICLTGNVHSLYRVKIQRVQNPFIGLELRLPKYVSAP